MTCFWDSIFSELSVEDYQFIGHNKCNNIVELIKLLKSKNPSISNVTWQKEKLSNSEINEHHTAIKVYDINGIKNGHLTSICDSFLLLVCQVFNVSIEHRFMNTPIYYDNIKNSRKTIRFSSNSGHFQNAPNASSIVKTTQSRLDRIRQKAIDDSQKAIQDSQHIKKKPSWRANPKKFEKWRQNMRNMKI